MSNRRWRVHHGGDGSELGHVEAPDKERARTKAEGLWPPDWIGAIVEAPVRDGVLAMRQAADREGRLEDGEPCNHPGCLSHSSHPCEGCGRIQGRKPPVLSFNPPLASLVAAEALCGIAPSWAEREVDRLLSRVKELTDGWKGDINTAKAWAKLQAQSTAMTIVDALESYVIALGQGGVVREPNAPQFPCPEWAEFWTLDQAAECLECGDSVTRKLYSILAKVRDEDRTPQGGDGSNGTVEEPVIDSGFQDNLHHHWDKLTAWEQQILLLAYEADYGD